VSYEIYAFTKDDAPSSPEDAAQRLELLNDRTRWSPATSGPAATAAQELTEMWPALEDLDEDEVAESPWALSPYASTDHVEAAVQFSRAKEVVPIFIQVAHEQGLTVYDPQGGGLIPPPGPAKVTAADLVIPALFLIGLSAYVFAAPRGPVSGIVLGAAVATAAVLVSRARRRLRASDRG
jgi:hypothetical protein